MEKPCSNDMRYWVWMSLVFGAASPHALELLARYDNPQNVYEAMIHDEVPNLPQAIMRSAHAYSLGQAENLVEFCGKHGIALITIDDPKYPYPLTQIHLPPILLTAQGNLDLLGTTPSLTVVGTRHPSKYSLDVTTVLVKELSLLGFHTVSGFADGIDTAAHAAALDNDGMTTAVLGCGVNVNYPHGNAQLRMRFLDSGRGLFLSEYLPGVQPIPANFPRRNRIMSALSHGTAVMEASMRSGSLVTADFALEQGKTIFCVPPHDVFDPRYAGVMPLLRDGATPLFSYVDVLYEYGTTYPYRVNLTQLPERPKDAVAFAEEAVEIADRTKTKERAEKKAEDAWKSQPVAPTPPASVSQNQKLPDTDEKCAIVKYLRENGDTHINDLADALDMDLSTLLSELVMLELEGYVETLFGSSYRAT